MKLCSIILPFSIFIGSISYSASLPMCHCECIHPTNEEKNWTEILPIPEDGCDSLSGTCGFYSERPSDHQHIENTEGEFSCS